MSGPAPDAPDPSAGLTRRLAAVWFADVVAYTTLSERDEDAALAAVAILQDAAREAVDAVGGRVVKFLGDGVLAEFASVDAAVRAALEVRDRYRPDLPVDQPGGALRVGVHVGEVAGAPDGDIYGDGVNVASRIQGEAEPGQVVVSAAVHEQLRQRPGFRVVPVRGRRRLKGLRRRHRLFAVEREGEEGAAAGAAAGAGSAAGRSAWSGRPVAVGLTTAVVGFLFLTTFIAFWDGSGEGDEEPAVPTAVPTAVPAGELRVRASRSLSLGVEYYFTGDYEAAVEQLAPFEDAPFLHAPGARRALRYLARAELEGGDPDGSRTALGHLLELEPPLALLIPAVESDSLMDLYYEARRDHVGQAPVGTAPGADGRLLLFDFRVVAPGDAALTAEDRAALGPMLADMLWTDLSLQGMEVVDVEKMSFAEAQGDDAYAALDRTLAAGGEGAPTHALLGALTVRGDRVLLSAWVFELRSGALAAEAQVIGALTDLTELPERLAGRLRQEMG